MGAETKSDDGRSGGEEKVMRQAGVDTEEG